MKKFLAKLSKVITTGKQIIYDATNAQKSWHNQLFESFYQSKYYWLTTAKTTRSLLWH
ncbi:hypothetical protein D082_01870 [Synechocystis sp. PCC 6714]|nr:hypothetical protein D082_01870 [Synechocystis sp. PCC 6714]